MRGMRAHASDPVIVDDLGELEGCLGVEDSSRRRANETESVQGSRLQRAAAAASFAMQLAQKKMLCLGGMRAQPAVESSATFAEVGSAAWCGLDDSDSAERTPTQLACAKWKERGSSHALGDGATHKHQHSETASVSSAADTLAREDVGATRELVSTRVHAVQPHDSLSGLCLQHEVSPEELLACNKPASRSSLLARKSILIPVFGRRASPPPSVCSASERGLGGCGGDEVRAGVGLLCEENLGGGQGSLGGSFTWAGSCWGQASESTERGQGGGGGEGEPGHDEADIYNTPRVLLPSITRLECTGEGEPGHDEAEGREGEEAGTWSEVPPPQACCVHSRRVIEGREGEEAGAPREVPLAMLVPAKTPAAVATVCQGDNRLTNRSSFAERSADLKEREVSEAEQTEFTTVFTAATEFTTVFTAATVALPSACRARLPSL